MSTILFFTSDRFAFANLSPSATTEKIILTPDPVDGTRLFIGNSTMVGYDARCNISTFDGSRATMTIDTVNNRVGIGISSPTVALDIVDAGGVRIVGPTNITGATTFTGNSRVIGTATATSFTGSAIGLTSIPAARIVGSLPATAYASATIPVTALSGYDNGRLLLSGHLATESLNVSTISTQHGTFSSLNSGNAGIDILTVRNFSTAFGFTSTFTVGTLFVGSISSGSIGSFQTNGGTFSSISAGTAAINLFNTSLLSTGSGTASSFTVGILYAATISSGMLVSLSSALISVSNAGNTNTANITTVSNAGVSNATNITSVSNAVITVSNAAVSISNAGTTNTTNITTVSNSITTVSNTVNYLLSVSNISAVTISTSYGFFSTISTGSVFGRFIGDGSLLTNLPVTSALTTVSNIASTNTTNITSVSNSVTEVSNNIITVSNTASTNTVNIISVSNTASTNTVNIASVSNSVTEVSNNITSVSNTTSTNTVNITSVSNFVTEVSNNITSVSNTTSTNTVNITSVSNSVTEVSNNIITVSNTASTNTVNVTSVSNFVTEVSNNLISVSNTTSTNTVNIATVSNSVTEVSNKVNYLLAVSNISAVTMSTSFGFFSTISTGRIFGRFIGDGSLLTGIVGGGGMSYVPPVLSTTFLSTGTLTASNISVGVISTTYGFFSTISTGNIFGRFVGDGSLLTNLPVTAALTTVSNTGTTNTANITTVSNTVNYLLAVSNISAATMSTSFGFFSTISSGSIFGRFVGDGSGLTNLPTTAALTTVSNTGATNTANITTVSNTVNYLLAVSNISAAIMSTSYGFFSTISSGRIFGRFVGDGSLLTGIVAGISIVPPVLSTTLLSTGILTARNISTAVISTNAGFASSFYINNLTTSTITALLGSFSSLSVSQVYISSLTVDNLTIGNDNGYINMGDIIAGSLSTTIVTAANVVALNISATIISTSYGFFSTISSGRIFGRFVGDGSGLTGITSGSLSIVPPVLSTTLLSTGILTASNISTAVISTNYGFFSTISSGIIYARFVGDGSLLTNLPVTTALTTVSNTGTTNTTNITSVSNTVNYLLAVSNISAATMSTSFGFFSTISSGRIFGRFVGDGSLLTNLPVTEALTIVSNTGISNTTNITTVSNTVNYLLAVSNISAATMSTSYGFFSTISSGIIFGRFVGDGSLLTNLPVTAALTTVSNTGTTNTANITTVSNSVNYLLAVSNISAATMSTSFGFFSTISTGRIFGRFVGDGSLLTGIVAGISIVPPVLSTTLLSTGILTASNISVGVISTTYGFFSTISAGTIFGRFVGDGSLLTGLVGGISIVPPVLSTTLLSTGILTARNISTLGISTNTGFASSFHINRLTTSTTSALLGTFSSISAGQAYISSLTVDSLFIGNDIGFTNMGDIIATSLSTIQVTTGNLIAVNISTTTTSTNYGFFSTISAGTIYAKFVGDGSGLTGIASGGLSIIPPVLSTTFMSTGFLTARNISVGVMSTSYGFFSTISAGTVFGRFVGDGSMLTNLPVTSALTTVSNSVSAVSNTVNYLLAVSNISAVTISTSYGFFSTISAGTVFGRFVGDGSMLTNLPVTSALTTVSNSLVTTSNNLSTVSNSGVTNATNITTVSNSVSTVSNTVDYLLAVSNISAITLSTSFGFFSTISAGTVFGRFVGDGSLLTNLPVTSALTIVSNSLVTTSNNLSTVSNSGVTNATNIGTVSNSVTAVSNTVNYLLAVSNLSAITISTSFGFFSTISAGTVFGRFVGDGSLLTGIVGSGGMSYVPPVLSTSLLSTGILTARSISTIVISTSYGFFSTISAGTVYGRFVGDGSLLTGLPVGVTSILSTQAFYTSSISSANITSAQGYISSLIVDVLSFGLSNSYISMGDVIATSISTIQTYTSSLLTINLQVGNVSSLSYIAFPGLQQGYNQTIIAEQSTGTGTQELLFYKGSTTTDRIRMQTTGSIIFEPGVGARLFPAVSSNVTPAMIINTSSNVGIGVAAPTTTLDVAGTGRFQILSTQQLFVSSISSGIMFGRFIGDGSGLTGISGGGGGISIVPPVLSTTLLSTGILTAASISSATGTFSSLSAGTANLDILNARLFSTTAGTASSFTIGSIFTSSGSVSSLRGDEARISTVTANTLSSYIVFASSVNTPNIYVTNIYANDGGIANVVASSLNASRAVFVQVIASSFQGSLIGKNILTVETY